MFEEKGYIQFNCDWEQAPAPTGPALDALRHLRDQLFDLGLIGIYPNGIGYGNLSYHPRVDRSFVITGTATGKLPKLSAEHLTEVTHYDAARNWLRCRGPLQASSESLSHAAVYDSEPTVRAVIHVHHMGMWKGLYNRVPTTDPQAEAGTPAMAEAIEELFRHSSVRETGFFVMGGHSEGVVALGQNLDEARERLLKMLSDYH